MPLPKKVLVALPPGLLEQIDFVSQVEFRTRSDLIREALRRYVENYKKITGHVFAASEFEIDEEDAVIDTTEVEDPPAAPTTPPTRKFKTHLQNLNIHNIPNKQTLEPIEKLRGQNDK